MPGVIDPEDYDPDFPGGNYEDWIMLVVPPNKFLESSKLLDQLIALHRRMRENADAGVKPKRNVAPKLEYRKLYKRPEPTIKIRRLI